MTNSQLFPFTGSAGPLALTPENASGTCLTVKGAVIDQAPCNAADPDQSFTFGGSVAADSGVDNATPTTTAQAETGES